MTTMCICEIIFSGTLDVAGAVVAETTIIDEEAIIRNKKMIYRVMQVVVAVVE